MNLEEMVTHFIHFYIWLFFHMTWIIGHTPHSYHHHIREIMHNLTWLINHFSGNS